MKRQKILAACVLLGACMAANSAPQPYRMAQAPPWVEVAADAPFVMAAKPVEEGESDYLLVDQQVRLGRTTDSYARYVERLVSQASVDENGSISIDIDPEHELVLLHDVRVFRNGRVLDKLGDARRSLLNREEELEQRRINGRVTLHLLLQDVRVGDILDYSFTRERTDPISERGYDGWFTTQWSVPVRHLRVRVLRPDDRTLYEQDLSKLAAPKRKRSGAWNETVWEAHDVAALANETVRPGWHHLYPRIELSEFANWNAVRAWALPMYTVPAPADVAVAAQIVEFEKIPGASGRILAALRFVQDDIRYTGLEIGAGAWRPTQPGVVLRRRFGDCKDKVLLLVTLLRGLGVEAYPALVNSISGKGIGDRLPSPGVFDHVIAKMRWQGRDYWLDATASGAGGGLATLVQADFGLALVLGPAGGGLESIPVRAGGAATNNVIETFDFSKGIDQVASLVVQTTLRDEDADEMRVKARSNTATKIGKEYLDYYHKSYQGIRLAKPLSYHDDRENNVFSIEETYQIDSPFDKDSENARNFYFEAYLVSEQTRPPEQAVRSSPLARTFPMHVHHRIVAYLPGAWRIKDRGEKLSDPAFEYSSSSRLRKHQLVLEYELRNQRDHVPVTGLPAFLTKLDQAHDDAFYTLTVSANADAQAGLAAAAGGDPSVELFATLFIGLGLGVWIARALARLRWKLPAAEQGAPAGLGGVMVLPVLGVLTTPIYLLYTIGIWFHDIGSATQFQALSGTVQMLLVTEFLIISVLLVVAAFSVWLMFVRYRTFPYAFVVMQILAAAMIVIDSVTLNVIGDAVARADGPQFGKMMIRIFIALIWITYILTSQRARATFVVAWNGLDFSGTKTVPAA